MAGFAKGMMAFFLPGGLVLLAALGFLRPHGLPGWLQSPVSAIPYIVLIFGLVFGWYLSNTRLILSLLILAGAERALTVFPMADPHLISIGQKVFDLTAFLLPLNLLALSMIRTDAPSAVRNGIRLLLLCAQAYGVWWLCYPDQQEWAASFGMTYITRFPTGWTPVPQPALAAFLLAGTMHLTQFMLKRDPLDAGSFWALATVFLAYHGTQSGWQPTNFFSAAGLILFLCILLSMHRQAYRDELTGILGQQAYDEATHQLGTRYAFAVLALDQLRAYASMQGRSVGDQVFRVVAQLIQSACQGAKVYRVSGEELIVLFPGCAAVETLPTLETARKTIEATSLILCRGDRVRKKGKRRVEDRERELPVTISAGVAEHREDSGSLSTVQRAAYRALYEAKSAGGNVIKRGSAAMEEARRAHGGQGRVVANGKY